MKLLPFYSWCLLLTKQVLQFLICSAEVFNLLIKSIFIYCMFYGWSMWHWPKYSCKSVFHLHLPIHIGLKTSGGNYLQLVLRRFFCFVLCVRNRRWSILFFLPRVKLETVDVPIMRRLTLTERGARQRCQEGFKETLKPDKVRKKCERGVKLISVWRIKQKVLKNQKW